MRDECAAEKTRLLAFTDGWAMAQGVVAAGFDGMENGEAAPAEHFEIDAEAGVDHFFELHALGEERARATDQILHEVNVTIVEAALHDFSFGHAVRRCNIQRNVDAAFFQVARDVLPEIGELQCSAGGVGKTLALLVTIPAEIEDEASDGICGIDAILKDTIPGRESLYGLFLSKPFHPITKSPLRQIFTDAVPP